MCRPKNDEIRTDRIDVLDGIRAGAILIVAFFHFWQQSWYWFTYKSPFLQKIGIEQINFDWIHRYGFIFVDMMILLTGFCLFLPYARYMVEGGTRPGLPNPKELWVFYKKRLARIVPSYMFCFLIFLFVFILPTKDYAVWTDIFKDKHLMQNIFGQLTFTQNLKYESYLGTCFNGALWTVAVEMQFYLIFPLVAWAFRKKPLLIWAIMNFIQYGFIQFIVLPRDDGNISMVINQLPALLGVFANGMMAALVFVSLANAFNKKRNKYIATFATITATASMFGVFAIMKAGTKGVNLQRWQVSVRFPVVMLFTIFVLSSCFAVKWYRYIFSNPVARFLATISYNFYIWHQVIAVKFKEWHIPGWEGEKSPNMAGDKAWQIKYTIIIVLASLAFATLTTYLIEKPMWKLIMKRKKKVCELK